MKNCKDETITEKFNKLDVLVAVAVVVVLMVWGVSKNTEPMMELG